MTHKQYAEDLVSVVMPTYNAAPFLRESIDSVLGQTYPNLELLVSDDASTDDTRSILEEYSARDTRVRTFLAAGNAGAAVSRNTALRNSTGQYIAFLDADDAWESDKLGKQIDFMRTNDASFSFTAYEICNVEGKPTGKHVDLNCPDTVNYFDMLLKRATLGCSTVMVDQSVTGPLEMPLIRTGQDYALWLQLLKKTGAAHRLPEVLTRYRIVPGSISRNKLAKARRQWSIYREIERIPMAHATWYFFNYAFRAVFRS